MKYNVYDDLLLLRGTGSQPLQVHKSRVEKFSINGLDFINIRVDSTASVHGFYEIMLQDQDHLLLKQHKKSLRNFSTGLSHILNLKKILQDMQLL